MKMNDEVLDVVRGTGRFGLVASVVLSLGSYIMMIMLIALAIIVNKVPRDMAKVTVYGGAEVVLDMSEAGLEDSAVANLKEYMSSGVGAAAISFGRFSFVLNSYEETEAGGVGSFGGDISGFALKDLSKVLIYVIVYLAVSAVMFAMNGFFAKALKDCKTPFSETVTKPLSNFAFMLVIWSFVRAAIYGIIGGAFTGVVTVTSSEVVVVAMAVLFYMVVRVVKASATLVEE